MFYKKVNLLENSTSVTDCVNKLIANITETYSGFISVTKNENTISFNDVAKNRKIFDLTIQADNNGVGITLYRAIGNVSRLQQFGLTTAQGTVFDETYGSPCGYLNNPTEFIAINKTTFAITLGPLNNSTYPGMKKPGILIFTKTIKGNIAIIQPSYMIGVGKNTESNPNCLSCLTYESTGEQLYFSNILFESAITYQTVLSPTMVNGDGDYCDDCFWIPMIQFQIEKNDDVILEIAGEYYYYNGFIACKIGN